MEITCGPLTFTANFDSGNLNNVELLEPNVEGTSDSLHGNYSNIPDYEVNIWTKPDCFGTKYQNGNRTWFYFGVNGGKSNGIIKMNILNLNKQIKLFEQGMQPVVCCIPDRPKWERIKDRVQIIEQGIKEHSCGITFRQKLPVDTLNSTIFVAFTYPFSYLNMCDWLNNVDSVYAVPSPMSDQLLLLPSDIYYRRECVCLSIEGRRVDLLTITSAHGQLSDHEDYLYNLFPYRTQPRPHKFHKKKVIFLSSRVHPGEVPAQFVMNGLIKFLLEERDPRAVMLRRLFVFKLIPIVNPDGVHNGHYRTDPRGVNLNRVYLKPSPILHPSIYAARKLVLYAHFGHDTPDNYDYEVEPLAPEPESFQEESGEVVSDLAHQPCSGDSENNRLCVGCIGFPSTAKDMMESENLTENDDTLLNKLDEENLPFLAEEELVHSDVPDEGHQCTFESCDEDSIIDYHDVKRICSRLVVSTSPSNEDLPSMSHSTIATPSTSSSASGSSTTLPTFLPRILTPASNRPSRSLMKMSRQESPEMIPKLLPVLKASKRGHEHEHSILKSTEMESGLFLYIDMHGHATKRGIFMYGNHFNDISVQTECMLLPRLMSLNCQHFDFAACNFTERLMNLKDRRDGLSREGSGRVAVLKLTGLIRSYTLECNYNTGRLVNHLITRPESLGISDHQPQSQHHPPKFTPELYESAGKSLGESILDLTGVNPWTRLKSTEYQTLDGLRTFLHRRLQHTIEYKASPMRRAASAALVSSGSKTTTVPPVASTSKSQTKHYSLLRASSLKERSIGSRKIISAQASSSASCSSGPLGPKKENQSLPEQKSVTNLTSKGPFNKPTTSKGKLKSKTSKSLPNVSQQKVPSTPTPDNRSSLTKVLKLKTTKKKKVIKAKSKKSKPFVTTRSELR